MYGIYDRQLEIKSLESKIPGLHKEIKRARDESASLSFKCEKKRGDMERYEKKSPYTLLLRITGKYKRAIEREQREEEDIKLACDRAAARFESLTQELNTLKQRVFDIKTDERRYRIELVERRSRVDRLTGNEARRYADMEDGRSQITARIAEIKETLRAAARVKATAYSALDALEKARKWATFDAFTQNSGLITHSVKYKHIDNAERDFNVLVSQVRDLKAALGDARGISANGLSSVPKTQRFVDFWFDNLFTDLSVRKQIMNNAEQLNLLLRTVENVDSTLREQMKQSESDLAANRREEEAFLFSNDLLNPIHYG